MNAITKLEIDLELSRRLGIEPAFYYSILCVMFDRTQSETLHIPHTEFSEFTDDSVYKIQMNLKILEQNNLLSRTPNGHGNINRYKLNRNGTF